VSPTLIQAGTTNKLVQEFMFLRAQASEPLGGFLDFITYEYMIDNVILLLKGTLNGRDVNELIPQVRNVPSPIAVCLLPLLISVATHSSTRWARLTPRSCAASARSSPTPRATRISTRPC
jgi:hypothetical protein